MAKAKVKFTQMAVRVERIRKDEIRKDDQGQVIESDPVCPLDNALGFQLTASKSFEAVLLPRSPNRSKCVDPVIAYAHDPNEKWEEGGTWLYLSTILKKGLRVIAIESGKEITLPGDLNLEY